MDRTNGAHHHHHPAASTGVTDPVCGMAVDPDAGGPRLAWDGRTFYFCAEGCRDRFLGDPESFLSDPSRKAPENARQDAEYTCPMHPEVRQTGPGTCPICGMA